MKFPVFDLHCDTALELLGKDLRSPKSLKKNNLHIDLERAKSLPGYCLRYDTLHERVDAGFS